MNLPEVNVSCEELYRMLYAPIKQEMMSGIELNVLTPLSETNRPEEVARDPSLSRNTMLFLMAWLPAA